jgi:hypothetical protein
MKTLLCLKYQNRSTSLVPSAGSFTSRLSSNSRCSWKLISLIGSRKTERPIKRGSIQRYAIMLRSKGVSRLKSGEILFLLRKKESAGDSVKMKNSGTVRRIALTLLHNVASRRCSCRSSLLLFQISEISKSHF